MFLVITRRRLRTYKEIIGVRLQCLRLSKEATVNQFREVSEVKHVVIKLSSDEKDDKVEQEEVVVLCDETHEQLLEQCSK